MLPCLLRRVGEFCSNPQDLLTRDDLAAFLQSEYGLGLDDSLRLIAWLVGNEFLAVGTHRGYAAELAAVSDTEVLRPGPAFIDIHLVALHGATAKTSEAP